jgi:hypothetical protein
MAPLTLRLERNRDAAPRDHDARVCWSVRSRACPPHRLC